MNLNNLFVQCYGWRERPFDVLRRTVENTNKAGTEFFLQLLAFSVRDEISVSETPVTAAVDIFINMKVRFTQDWIMQGVKGPLNAVEVGEYVVQIEEYETF